YQGTHDVVLVATEHDSLYTIEATNPALRGTILWRRNFLDPADPTDNTLGATAITTSQTALDNFGFLPGSPVVSADGTSNGIVWTMDRDTNKVHAYDANSLATELWNSGQKAGGADAVGAVVKFATPTVAGGQLFIGTSNSLLIYGLTPPASAAPD